MALVKQAMKKLLALSAAALLGAALLMFDPGSRTLVSEAHACDWDWYQICSWACLTTCGTGQGIPNCDPNDPFRWCEEYCRADSGC